ncbi:hypothetical protein C6A87_001240 [Mycobacterium sp. ITM-2016-00317]|uniref:hypothetical protein n=1 Tax=Mycobacterium sp. ITM-2016-00317 TaxID=2099694 RepID=UPI00287F9658|nr:hypothetical protein [Mycobacterium sp. ITM-2016-00317]WNG87938.1 hypothetical protein C6A87_001240 [Mycobacterium sp. ITM-2016-00317]
MRNAVSNATSAAQRATDKSAPPQAQPREDREIESWLGDLRGAGASGAGTPPAQPMRPSAEPTRAMPDTGAGGNEPTTAIPTGQATPQDDDADETSTRAIPTPRQTDADAATEKLNTRPDEEQKRRGGGNGVSAQDLLRREGRL